MKKNFYNSALLTTLTAAMVVTSVTSCQSKVATSSEETPSPSYSEPKLQSGTMKAETQRTTTSETLTIESVTRGYTASTDTIIENGEVVGTYIVPETVVTTVSVSTPQETTKTTTAQSPTAQPKPEKTETNHNSSISTNETHQTPSNSTSVSTEPIGTDSNISAEQNSSEDTNALNNTTSENSDKTHPFRSPGISIPSSKISKMYTVQEGDSLWAIANMHGITIHELVIANNIDINDVIMPNQQLIIPKVDAVVEEILHDAESIDSAPENNYYVVAPDDCFSSIAEKFNVTPEALAVFNGKTLSDYIYPGDLLKIPSTSECNIETEYSITEENAPFVELTAENVSEENISEENASEENSSEISSPFVELSEETVPIENATLENNSTESINLNYSTETANDILSTIKNFETEYVGTNIAMGIYSLDGTPLFEYNTYSPISGACTVKAPYAMYVLECCEQEGIDIWSETLQYQDGMKNDGSGNIKNDAVGSEYTIAYLLTQLLSISDNTAYNILVSRFSLDGYQVFLNSIGGQQLYGLQYGTVSVEQRKNEWLAIYNYINSNRYYSYTLQQMLSNTAYCYLVQGMANWHNYMHKSGWSDGANYTSASDCAIIDNQYLVIVLSQDYVTGTAHTDIVNVLGREAEIFMG